MSQKISIIALIINLGLIKFAPINTDEMKQAEVEETGKARSKCPLSIRLTPHTMHAAKKSGSSVDALCRRVVYLVPYKL
jgi:metal-sulfur cluster biosynthetic enzyme